MNTKEKVIDTLLLNLNTISSSGNLSREHHLVKEYVSKIDQPYRVYHSWDHIHDMLESANELPEHLIEGKFCFTAAILFHDSIYFPNDPMNESNSSKFASKFYEHPSFEWIDSLIRATSHEFPFVTYRDDRDILHDLDLQILGSSRVEFMSYRSKIAREFQREMTFQQFLEGSNKFFENMLEQSNRDFIFRTNYFRDMYEEIARENLECALCL